MSTSDPGGRAPWRAVVVDDQALLVSAFEMLLSAQPDLEVTGTAADGAAALELLRSRAPCAARRRCGASRCWC